MYENWPRIARTRPTVVLIALGPFGLLDGWPNFTKLCRSPHFWTVISQSVMSIDSMTSSRRLSAASCCPLAVPAAGLVAAEGRASSERQRIPTRISLAVKNGISSGVIPSIFRFSTTKRPLAMWIPSLPIWVGRSRYLEAWDSAYFLTPPPRTASRSTVTETAMATKRIRRVMPAASATSRSRRRAANNRTPAMSTRAPARTARPDSTAARPSTRISAASGQRRRREDQDIFNGAHHAN